MHSPEISRRPLHRAALDAALLVGLSLGALYATARTALAPRDPSRGVAVVFAPWVGADAAFGRTVAAGARFVRFGGPGFVTMAIPEDSGFAGRVRAAGALLVADPKVVAACMRALGAVGR